MGTYEEYKNIIKDLDRCNDLNISIFQGQIFKDIQIVKDREYDTKNDLIIFTNTENKKYVMFHPQEGYGDVYIEDICGEISDMLFSPILIAEESNNTKDIKDLKKTGRCWEEMARCTWTFYKIATVKGYLTIRWYGESNGYYSEEAVIREYCNGEAIELDASDEDLKRRILAFVSGKMNSKQKNV